MEDDLPAMDLEALDRYLCSDRAPDHCMALSGLDGFLTAVVIAPDRIPPSEWLPVIWGDEEPEFESEAELRTILATIMGRYSQIATCFESDPDDFDPIFREGPRGEVDASDWAAGFLDAVAMRREAWEPMIRHRRARILLAPLLFLGDQSDVREADVDWEKVAREAPHTIPTCVIGIHDFWQHYRQRQRPQPRRGGRHRR